MPGHDPGHSVAAPPPGLDWGEYVASWMRDRGTWTNLADELISRARDSEAIPIDVGTVERGLRRLAKREHKPGGQYGRWMLRYFGFTEPVENWLRWMGQYHTRFADLPCSLRLSQLRLWYRPPTEESRLAAWLELGLASVHLRLADEAAAKQWLARAENTAERAGAAATIEASLFRARLDTGDGDRAAAVRALDRAEALLDSGELSRADRLCYRARLLGQRAYHLTKPAPGQCADIAAAAALFGDIEEDPSLPFVSFRKCAGLAYCAHNSGDVDGARDLARRAADHAGDGGLVRFRVMALNLLVKMLPKAEADATRARAERLAAQLEDEDLLERARR